MYSKGAKTIRLIVGIISIVLSVVVLFQSCAVGVGNSLSENGETGGSGGAILAIVMLISGIISIAARSTKGGTITAVVFFALGAIVAFANAGSYSDLKVWAVIAIIFAVLLCVSLKMKAKDGELPDNNDKK